MTYEELQKTVVAVKAKVESLTECCAKCKHVGRSRSWNRTPSAQCCLNPPGSFTVLEVTTTTLSGKMFSRKEERVPTSFPPVEPWDKCGKFELAPESEFLFPPETSSS